MFELKHYCEPYVPPILLVSDGFGNYMEQGRVLQAFLMGSQYPNMANFGGGSAPSSVFGTRDSEIALPAAAKIVNGILEAMAL